MIDNSKYDVLIYSDRKLIGKLKVYNDSNIPLEELRKIFLEQFELIKHQINVFIMLDDSDIELEYAFKSTNYSHIVKDSDDANVVTKIEIVTK